MFIQVHQYYSIFSVFSKSDWKTFELRKQLKTVAVRGYTFCAYNNHNSLTIVFVLIFLRDPALSIFHYFNGRVSELIIGNSDFSWDNLIQKNHISAIILIFQHFSNKLVNFFPFRVPQHVSLNFRFLAHLVITPRANHLWIIFCLSRLMTTEFGFVISR